MSTTTEKVRLVVCIDQEGSGRFVAKTEDTPATSCLIDLPPQNLTVGDRWVAEAVAGVAYGEKGRTKIRLLTRLSQGMLLNIPGHWVEQDSLLDLQAYLDAGIHVLIRGPQGSGKTTLAGRLAHARGWNVLQVDCQNVINVSQFFGADAMVRGLNGSGSETRFIPSVLTNWLDEAVRTTGLPRMLVFDELARVDPKAQNALLALLGPMRKTTVPTIAGGREIVLPKHVVVVATANIGRKFVGGYPLDPALKDRFVEISVARAPVIEMVRLLQADPRWERLRIDDMTYVVTAGQIFNDQYESRATIAEPPSYRGVEAALALIAAGRPARTAVQRALLGNMTPKDQADLQAALDARFVPPAAGS